MSNVILSSVVVAVAVTCALVVIVALSRRSAPAADGTAVSLRGEVAEQPCGSGEHLPLPDPTLWQSATVSDLTAAEELLDWAEAEGYQERELSVVGNDAFLVRWRGRA